MRLAFATTLTTVPHVPGKRPTTQRSPRHARGSELRSNAAWGGGGQHSLGRFAALHLTRPGCIGTDAAASKAESDQGTKPEDWSKGLEDYDFEAALKPGMWGPRGGRVKSQENMAISSKGTTGASQERNREKVPKLGRAERQLALEMVKLAGGPEQLFHRSQDLGRDDATLEVALQFAPITAVQSMQASAHDAHIGHTGTSTLTTQPHAQQTPWGPPALVHRRL